MPNEALSADDVYRLCRFALRYSDAEDAMSARRSLSVNEELHADLFLGFEWLRERVLQDNGLFKRLLTAKPFIVATGEGLKRVQRIRLTAGAVSTDAGRMPIQRGAAALSRLYRVADEVPDEAMLPARAAYTHFGRTSLTPREVVKQFAYDFHYDLSASVKRIVDGVPSSFSATSANIERIQAAVEALCGRFGTSVYIRFNHQPATLINRVAPATFRTAMLEFGHRCRRTVWDTPTPGTRGAHVSRVVELTGRAASTTGPSLMTWPTDVAGLETTFASSDWRMDPSNAWSLHVIKIEGDRCAQKAMERATHRPWPTLAFYESIDDIREAAHVRGFGVHVFERGPAGVVMNPDHGKSQMVALVHDRGHYHVGAGIGTDDVVGMYPIEPVHVHTSLAPFPSTYPEKGMLRSWKQLYFSRDSTVTGAKSWLSWEDQWANLSAQFGDGTTPRDVYHDGVEIRDERVRQLAGWADYHRTGVIVNLENRTSFRILPHFAARAHHKARLGRALWIELGSHGARLYMTGPRRRHLAFNDVFVANPVCVGDL